MDPMQLFVYGELMFIASLQEDADGVRHWIEAALQVYPRRWNPIWSFAEQAWGAMGRCEERLEALRNIRLRNPFIGYVVFPRWAGTGLGVVGHVETPILFKGATRDEVSERAGALP